MRLIAQIKIPNEPFNTFSREGNIGKKISKIIEATKPQAIYFTNHSGSRGAVAVYNCSNDSDIPHLGEPWFVALNAEVQFQVAMTPEDLAKAGLEKLGKEWR